MPTQLEKINFSLWIHQQERRSQQLGRFITKVMQKEKL